MYNYFVLYIFLLVIYFINCILYKYLYKSKSEIVKIIELMKNIFYISSYYDFRFKAIRLLLYTYNNSKFNNNISCRLIYSRNSSKCKLKVYDKLSEDGTVINILIFVNIIPNKILINNHYITIKHQNTVKISNKNNITVCIGKMINFTAYYMLIQLIESYLFLGVDHFIVYKTSCSVNVSNVLEYYSSKGVLDVIQFEKEFDKKYAKYKTYGQRIKLNDCFYRCIDKSQSLIMTDLDEILWPNKENTILEMIENVDRNAKRKYDTYIFQEKIFMRNYVPYFDRYVHNVEDCNIFDYHYCCDYTWEWPKLFIRNLSKITAVTIHWIKGRLDNYSETKVKSNFGYIRHTRRIYPNLIKGLRGNWSKCYIDKKEYIIRKRSERILKIINNQKI